MKQFAGNVVHRSRDEWGPIEVVDEGAVRSLHFGTAARQSAMSLHEPDYLLLSYTRAMAAALLFAEAPRRALLVGLGGGSLAKFLLHHFPTCRVEVVELRQEVVETARRHFALPDSDNLVVLLGDGGRYLNEAPEGGYDLILIDAYDAIGMAPSLGERDVLGAAYHALHPDGVLSVNTWQAERRLSAKVQRELGALFAGRVLTLPVEEKGNVILHCLGRAVGIRGVAALKRRAVELDRHLAIGLPQQLSALRRGNSIPRLARALL